MKKVLLLIDDNPMLVYFLSKDLSYNYEVKGFTKSEDAIDYIQKNKNDLDVVISDFKMPTYNGIEVLKAAKAAAPDAVRILLTGYVDTLDRIEREDIYDVLVDKNVIKDANELIKTIEAKCQDKRSE